MKIAVDIQPLQSPTSRTRGIGRYVRELAAGLLRFDERNDYALLTTPYLDRPDLSSLPHRGWRELPVRVRQDLVSSDAERNKDASERFRFTSLLQLQLLQEGIDVYHVTSPFEWLYHQANALPFTPTVVTMHDLIPFLFPRHYLDRAPEIFRTDFYYRLNDLRKADLMLAVSQCTKDDLVRLLDYPADRIHVTLEGVGEHFRLLEDRETVYTVGQRFGITGPYVMCTGGMDGRKNHDGLFRAFAGMDEATRSATQLVIVCQLQGEEESLLRRQARELGIGGRLVLTNEISEEELIALYNGATVFAFPSFYEGFGLPVLEAMRCGAPVVCSDRSSLPEVAGEAAIMVDPSRPEAISMALEATLSNAELRSCMRERGLRRAQCFSWQEVARRTVAAYETLAAAPRSRQGRSAGHRRMAFFTPLNPMRSGIADYAEDLLPHLAARGEIDIYVDGYQPTNETIVSRFPILDHHVFEEVAPFRRYDVLIYQMGNNAAFHAYMYDLLQRHPGLVVQHDYVLHGLMHGITLGRGDLNAYLDEVEYAEGRQARDDVKRNLDHPLPVFYRYPLSRRVVERSLALIVHSSLAQARLQERYAGVKVAQVRQGVPHFNALVAQRDALRQALCDPRAFLIACFGRVDHTKRWRPTVRAFARLTDSCPSAHLVFVGQLNPGEYGEMLAEIAQLNLRDRVTVTGHVSRESFERYLAIADLCINLRYPSAGETSATLHRALAVGLPVLVSDVGQYREYPDDCCWRVPVDGNEEAILAAYMARLARDTALRHEMGRRARAYALRELSWEQAAEGYWSLVEGLLAEPRPPAMGRKGGKHGSEPEPQRSRHGGDA